MFQVATEKRPLVVFMDSVDQLAASHRAHYLAWVPQQLPPHVHFVVSTLPREYGLLDTLHSIIHSEENFVQILPLGTSVSLNIIREWLGRGGRTLTTSQFQIVETALEQCSLPLYMRLVIEEVSRWKSYWSPSQTQLASSVKGVINSLFDRLETVHGKMFTSNVLSYITASKNGLSDMELDDLISLDDDVLNDVFQHWVPPVRRVPPLLWPRLLNDLGSYIMKREANGIIVYYWYHRQFISVARERYLENVGHKLYIHSSIAHYFLGTWGGGHKKPFRYSVMQMELLGRDKRESLADRKVPPQPLIFHRDPNNPEKVSYNLRKLSELPYHLLVSKRISDLKTEVLFNYEWLHTKLSAMGLQDVLSDFRSTVEFGVVDPEILLVGSAIRVGGSYVNQNPDTLAFDLIGRLLPYYSDHMNIRNLIQQCDTMSLKHSAVVPLFQCFEAPKKMLLYILEEHTQTVFDFIFSKLTNELISVSKDNTISFWDLATGERTRMLDISPLHPGQNSRLFQSADGKYLICDSDHIDSPVYIYDLKTGHLLHKVGKRSPTSKRIFMAGNLLCRQKNIIDVRTGRVFRTLDDFVETKQFVPCGITPNDRFILIGQQTETGLFDLELGVPQASFPGNNMPCVFAFTADSKKVYVGYTEDCNFKVFDIDPDSKTFGEITVTFNYKQAFPHMKFLEGQPFSKELAEIAICGGNPNLVLLNVKRCHLILLNLLTMTAKIVDGKVIKATNKTNLFGCSFSMDGRFMLAGHSHFLHIWSTENCRHLATLTLHTVSKFPMRVCQHRNLVATSSAIHTAIKVWNLDRIQSGEEGFLQKYGNPIDMVACVPEKRLVFVKHYYGYSSMRGYKYHDNFGLDVWNMSTGNRRNFLSFDAYGVLLQMEVSRDGQKIALLLSRREETFLVIVSIKTNKILLTLPHHECKSFTLSPNWEFAATYASDSATEASDVVLWSLQNGERLRTYAHASSPVFTLDSVYLLIILERESIIVLELKVLNPLTQIVCNVDHLQVVPNSHHVVLATRYPDIDEDDDESGVHRNAQVTTWYFHCGRIMTRFHDVHASGICDISKDGLRAVDGALQVFDLKTGCVLCGFNDCHAEGDYTFIQLTYDGQYLIWVDGLSLKVGRVQTGNIVARISMHEKPTSLTLLDYGYIAVIGREDGHLVTLRLLCEEDAGVLREPYLSLTERCACLLDIPVCADGAVNTFDPFFQMKPTRVKDSELPKLSEDLQVTLKGQANVPHSIIKTPSLSDLVNIGDDESAKRRGSSPMPHHHHHAEHRKSGGASSLCNSPGILSSPAVRRKEKSGIRHRSRSTQDFQGTPHHTTLPRSPSSPDSSTSSSSSLKKSTSLNDVFHVGGTEKTPRKKMDEEKRRKRKSPTMAALHGTIRALHNTGHFLMALTDVNARSHSLPRPTKPAKGGKE